MKREDEWTPWPSIRALTVLVVVLLLFATFVYLTTGCEHLGAVQRYQQKQELDCRMTHTAEQCRVLTTPACQPSNGGGQNGCHN